MKVVVVWIQQIKKCNNTFHTEVFVCFISLSFYLFNGHSNDGMQSRSLDNFPDFD